MKKMIAALAVGGLLAASIPQIPVAAAEIPALTDIVSLQKWILGESESTPTDGQTWDLNADGTVNITDLCQMKRQYTSVPVQNPLDALTGMDYQTAVANAYISKSEYGYQIEGNLKSTIEEKMGRPLDYSIDRFYLVNNETLGLDNSTKYLCQDKSCQNPLPAFLLQFSPSITAYFQKQKDENKRKTIGNPHRFVHSVKQQIQRCDMKACKIQKSHCP